MARPIRDEYVPQQLPIDFYQNIYASEPGSAEMPSAGRAFTWKMLFDLKRRGIKSTSIVLHTGLSSYLDDDLDARHPASEEELYIDAQAAEAINRCRMAGGRVIAIGTTVVRALESVSDEHGLVNAYDGYTRLIISAQHKLKCANGLITGLARAGSQPSRSAQCLHRQRNTFQRVSRCHSRALSLARIRRP